MLVLLTKKLKPFLNVGCAELAVKVGEETLAMNSICCAKSVAPPIKKDAETGLNH